MYLSITEAKTFFPNCFGHDSRTNYYTKRPLFVQNLSKTLKKTVFGHSGVPTDKFLFSLIP